MKNDRSQSFTRPTHVTARHPTTNRVLRIANSKIVRTTGLNSLGSNLVPITICPHYLQGSCAEADHCAHLHVLGLTAQGWARVSVPAEASTVPSEWCDGTKLHDEGWTIPVYDPSQCYVVDIPSQCVLRTQGSLSVMQQYNASGPRGRYDAYLCPQFTSDHHCSQMGQCPYIHTNEDISSLSHYYVHVNYEDGVYPNVPSYVTLPPGKVLRIFDPNIRSQHIDVPSEQVLRTQGSERHFTTGRGHLIHCAHFYLNKVCNRGPTCYFAHVKQKPPDAGPTLPCPVDHELPQILEPQERSNTSDSSTTSPATVQTYTYDPYMSDGTSVRRIT